MPVICCGNVTVGGSGKTPLALDLGERLRACGIEVHFLSRGYGGRTTTVYLVRSGDPSELVGDEALLLAQVAPTWIGADRVEAARAAVAAGAQALVMDDGLQNPAVEKDLSLLVIDGGFGFGNNRVLPAGPLREPVRTGAGRCHAAVLIGDDLTGAAARLPQHLRVWQADLVADADLSDQRVLAFAGIGRPDKFFATLVNAGAEIVSARRFADHHPYRDSELRRLLADAEKLRAQLVTTAKDAVRLPHWARSSVMVLKVRLVWRDPRSVGELLDSAFCPAPL